MLNSRNAVRILAIMDFSSTRVIINRSARLVSICDSCNKSIKSKHNTLIKIGSDFFARLWSWNGWTTQIPKYFLLFQALGIRRLESRTQKNF